ncbi:GNAT family N-acetyltransferase [Fusobacterium sp.]|uniref:GNAT family N-acetyltransferase n=1 Tax=Fusobacterium sp. TaxID=68766 RepID=UPI0028FE3FB9|nr:GNAT family N-acetyltransferase [Fusobacterium sp.]MDU1910342.1 GNAT family N-acetyltransferase [Fusobacterium sp.]
MNEQLICLKEINEENYNDCIALDVNEKQRAFVASNIYSIAQAYIYRDTVKLFCIYVGDTLIGFTMFNLEKEKDEYWICRFMIDKNYQRMGYGKKAIIKIVEFLKKERTENIKISFEPENILAMKLYSACGFKETGEVDEDGEIIMEIKIK